MSYCRWSTDSFQCDLYVYEDVAGYWTIHVAGNHVTFKEPLDPEPDLVKDGANAWYNHHVEVMERLNDPERHERVPLNLPYAGETLREPTAGACADRVAELIALGYQCPESVVPELRAEQAETDANKEAIT